MKHLVLPAVFAVFYFLARGAVWHGPFIYDEADYMHAARLGWRANATDSPALPLAQFVKIGLGRGRDSSQRTDLSEMIRNSGDVVFYRHWHGPLYTGWLQIWQRYAPDERWTRTLNFVFPAATALLMYFGALWLMPGAGGQIAAILASVLYLWSFPVVRTTELAPHPLFALCVVAALGLLAKMLQAAQEGQAVRGYWYGAIAVTAFAFCAMEVAFALILVVLICGCGVRERLKPDGALIAKSLGCFVAIVGAIWPAAIFKLSFLKAYLFMSYLAVFRQNAWGSNVGVAGTWWLRFVSSPVPWIGVAVATVFLLKNRRDASTRILTPFVAFSVIMFLAIFRVNAESPRYVLPLFPAVVLFTALAAGLMMAGWRPASRAASVVLICAVMLATSWPRIKSHLPRSSDKDFAMLARIRENDLARKTLLVPHDDLPMIHYYFPAAHLKSYYDESGIGEELRSGNIDGVIYRGDPPRFVPAKAFR